MQWGCWHSSSWTIWTSPSYYFISNDHDAVLVTRFFQGAELIARARWRISTKRKFWRRKKSPSKAAHLITHMITFWNSPAVYMQMDLFSSHPHWSCPKSLLICKSEQSTEFDAKPAGDYREILTDSVQLLKVLCSGEWVWKSSFACVTIGRWSNRGP